jgi:hypothetical protein
VFVLREKTKPSQPRTQTIEKRKINDSEQSAERYSGFWTTCSEGE